MLPSSVKFWDAILCYKVLSYKAYKGTMILSNTNKLHNTNNKILVSNTWVEELGCLSQQSSGDRWGTRWTGRQSSTGQHRETNKTNIHSYSSINLICMFFGLWEETGVPGGSKLHTFLVWDNHAPVPPCRPISYVNLFTDSNNTSE